jgi:hypothetical protein
MLKFSVKIFSITDPSGVCKLMDCSMTVFVDEFSNFFQHFLSFCLCSPWMFVNFNWHLTGLEMWISFRNHCLAERMFSKNFTKHFEGFGSRFTELRAKLDADTLLDFAIHHRQNETWSGKSTHAKTVCSQRGVTWQTDTIGLQKCDLGLSSHPLSPGS